MSVYPSRIAAMMMLATTHTTIRACIHNQKGDTPPS
jgi:hypothetical protein